MAYDAILRYRQWLTDAFFTEIEGGRVHRHGGASMNIMA
jgi:hypothetical protein